MPSPSTEAGLAARQAAEARFTANNPLSQQQHTVALGSLPGGNTRSILHTSPFPLTMKKGIDSYVWDVDGHRYLDLVGEFSAGLLGHSHPTIRRTIQNTLSPEQGEGPGISLGATTPHEQTYAATLCTRFHLDRVRLTNSGTEANLHALAGARHYMNTRHGSSGAGGPRWRKVVVFSGGYHGAVLAFGNGEPAANTVDRKDFVVVPRYNDLALAREVIERTAGVAAVLVEAVQGAGGGIPGTREFLMGVREAAREKGAVFILDEVMTSRLAPGGLGTELGLDPDMVTLGKYLGGGLAIGAFGGKEEIMRVFDPRVEGGLAHSGTFNNNTLVVTVGRVVLEEVYTPEVCREFNERAERFRERLVAVAKGSRLSFTGRGSLIGLHFTEGGLEEVRCGEDVRAQERGDLKDLFWFEFIEAGFWTTRRGFLCLILGTPEEELDRFVEAVRGILEKHKDLMML
ncbi:pyridoxal phosphate-dependent transferase [Dichotomopilus funicola]|uniref:Pyridoxal phosphate-dependent transferase n=1 Tax=Dichotomopilus funicola TaxID=1934379 RepID=A0AAN6ZQ24_9PEZI|nr:pyridoxal phosphate-dependent transferase [Dichotomopilus funicola]